MSTAVRSFERSPVRPQDHLAIPYPNPFERQASVEFSAPTTQRVRLELYDLMGRRIDVLRDAPAAAGTAYEAEIDGSRLPAGSYVLYLIGETFTTSRNLMKVR